MKVTPSLRVQRHIYINDRQLHECSFGNGRPTRTRHTTWHTPHVSALRRECISSPASRLGRQGQAHTLSIESQEPPPESLWRKDHAEDSATAVKSSVRT